MSISQNSYKNLVALVRIKACVGCVVVLATLFVFATNNAMAQGIRRPIKEQRIQKKLEKQGANKLSPTGESSTTNPKPADAAARQDVVQPQYPSLDGIRERGILSMFSREEAQLVIPGFGRPPALLIIFRQLNLTPEQKEKIREIRLSVGGKLNNLQRERALLDQQVEDAIYGENFSMARVDELAAQAAEKQSGIIKLQANIEAQFRQILTPDQFYVFQFLIGEMVMPQRRVNPQQLRQQQLRRNGQLPNGLNRQNPPPNLPNELWQEQDH
jgi:Spy/CpxP family protein refolding chaperone